MSSKLKSVLKIVLMLVILQLFRIIFRCALLLFIPITYINIILTNSLILITYLYIMIKICNKYKIDLKLFKVSNKNAYMLLNLVFIILFIISICLSFNIENIINSFYSILLIPIFEELLFRGYIWERLNKVFNKEIIVYIVVTLLFGLWHIGYIDSLLLVTKLNGVDFNIKILLYKVLIGLIYGVFTGLVRYKTKNTTSSILVHGIMNMFGR